MNELLSSTDVVKRYLSSERTKDYDIYIDHGDYDGVHEIKAVEVDHNNKRIILHCECA